MVLEVLATVIREEEETKFIQIGKEEVKLSLFADMIVYTENPIDSTKKTIQPNKWIWQNRRIQSQYSEIECIFYTNNEIMEKETKKKIPFTTVTTFFKSTQE